MQFGYSDFSTVKKVIGLRSCEWEKYDRCQNLDSSCTWPVEYKNLIRPDDCRYEIYLDEVKPNDLRVNFLQEFMDLPISYLAPGAAIKFRKYLLCLSIFKLLFLFLAINDNKMLLHVTC